MRFFGAFCEAGLLSKLSCELLLQDSWSQAQKPSDSIVAHGTNL